MAVWRRSLLLFLLPLGGAFVPPARLRSGGGASRPRARPPAGEDPASWSFERLQEEKALAQARQKQQAGAVGNTFLAVVVALAVRLAVSPAEIRREYICPAAIGGASKLPTDRSVYGGDCTPAGELLLKVIFAPVKLPFTEGYWTPPARVGGAPV